MAFTTKDTFTFDFTAQADYPSWTPLQTKQNMNARGEELRLALNALITALNSVTDGSSGADNLGMTPIPAIDVTANTPQAIMEALATRLQAITAGASGAEFIGAETIVGLTGNDVQTLLAALKALADTYNTNQTGALNTHKTSADHDGRYYTQALLNSGQLDTRYYTETELGATTDSASGADKIGATQVTAGSGTTVQAIVEWLYAQIVSVTLGQIPDGSLTNAKLATDIKVGSLTALTTTDKTSVTNAVNELKSSQDAHAADLAHKAGKIYAYKNIGGAL